MVLKIGCFLVVVGFSALADTVETRLGPATKEKKYSSRNLLHRRMLSLNPVYGDFVTGAKRGDAKFFYCRICKRDVKMGLHGAAEFVRHFGSKGHWAADVTYRVHMELPVYNKLMEPMELSATQEAEYRARPFVDLGPEFPISEDLLPKHARADSKVPFMTFVSGFCDLLRSGGDFSLLRRLWGCFLASLGKQEPLFTLGWSRSETMVGFVGVSRFFLFFLFFCFLSLVL